MADERTYRSILEGISGGFFALDRQYRVIYWNHAAETGTGLTAQEVTGRSVFEVFPNAAGAPLGEKYRIAMETRTFQSLETSYKDDRFDAWYDVRIYPTEEGIAVFFQNITDHKKEQRQTDILVEISRAINSSRHLDELCMRAAEKIALLFEIPTKYISLFLYDPRANEIRLVAPALFDIEFPQNVVHQTVTKDAPFKASQAAYTRETVLSDDITQATAAHAFKTEMSEAGLNTLVALPLIIQGELQGVLEVLSIKKKEYVEGELELLAVAANELASGISRRRLLDELRMKNIELETQTQKTKEASDTLKKFLATFSHELRSPLNSIVGFSELLTTDVESLDSSTQLEFLKNINTSGRHLQQIINDILDLSRIEAGKMDLHLASYPVSYFRENVERVLSTAIAEKAITLEFAFSSEFDEIVVDQTRFKQILINLVSNAIKFSSPKGTILIASERIRNDIQFSVTDRGLGIKPEELSQLFKPFRQASGGKERNKHGMGLGLAITKELVKLHGGNIWIESEWGKGTTVSFKIPMMVDAAAEGVMKAGMLLEALRQENRPESAEKPLALVVEDSPQAAELLKNYIESAGYRVELAKDGGDAVDKAKRLLPSVITLDLLLPVKDGWAVMQELKKHPLCKHIPIIIVSIIDEKSLGFSLGAVDYFVKPVNKADLLEAMDKVHLNPADGSARPTVLVIDDDKTATDLIQVILENEGYRVLKAFHGKDGVELAARENPDLIILDLIMPEISGFNVAYQLRQIPATRTIPIIILTSMEIDQETQMQLGAYSSGLIRKGSFTKKDLLREIGNIENVR
ncbi:MAG: response regulator [Ignavibacteria bacterium]|nr:response regulator [Ignavibacteria bacterium]